MTFRKQTLENQINEESDENAKEEEFVSDGDHKGSLVDLYSPTLKKSKLNNRAEKVSEKVFVSHLGKLEPHSIKERLRSSKQDKKDK